MGQGLKHARKLVKGPWSFLYSISRRVGTDSFKVGLKGGGGGYESYLNLTQL
jgi:hypothetical protein